MANEVICASNSVNSPPQNVKHVLEHVISWPFPSHNRMVSPCPESARRGIVAQLSSFGETENRTKLARLDQFHGAVISAS